MRKSIFAIAAFVLGGMASSAPAAAFPTIYVVSGVVDSGSGSNAGVATSLHCTNTSGQTVSVRILVLNGSGVVAGEATISVAHGATIAASTHGTLVIDNENLLSPLVSINHGGAVIEFTQSAVFCSAFILDAAATVPNGVALHMVRVNPHPGTVE